MTDDGPLTSARKAVFAKIIGNAGIMAKLGDIPPYPDRLPKQSKHSEGFASITFEGETLLASGGHWDMTFTLHVYAYDKELADGVVDDLLALFHSKKWRTLDVGAGRKALTRGEFIGDSPELGSELVHQVFRVRVRYG